MSRMYLLYLAIFSWPKLIWVIFRSFGKVRISSLKVILMGNSAICSFGGEIHLGSFHLGSNVELLAIGKGVLKARDRLFVNRNSRIVCMESITIGDDCLIGDCVSIYDHDHKYDRMDVPISKQGFNCSPVVIGDRVWIGSHAIICKGVRIGDDSIIAAGAVVVKSIPANCVAGGIPAKVIQWRTA